MLFSDKIRSEDTVTFDRINNILQFTATSSVQPIDMNAQDQLSVTFQLGFWVAANDGALNANASLPVQLVSKNNAEQRSFQFVGTELITLPGGKIEAYKIIRNPRSPDDQRATVWLLKNSGLTLYRLLLEEQNGDFVDQKLSQFQRISDLK